MTKAVMKAVTRAAMGATIAALLALAPAPEPPGFHGITLTETSLAEALVQLGPSSLVGRLHDAEGGSIEPTDPIFLRYGETVCLASSCYPSEMTVLFDPGTYLAQGITVVFSATGVDRGLPTADEVKKTFGASYRRVRHGLVSESEDLEGELSACDDPEGTIVSWIYRERGLQVLWLGGTEDRGPELRFHRALWDGSESYPPCARASDVTH